MVDCFIRRQIPLLLFNNKLHRCFVMQASRKRYIPDRLTLLWAEQDNFSGTDPHSHVRATAALLRVKGNNPCPSLCHRQPPPLPWTQHRPLGLPLSVQDKIHTVFNLFLICLPFHICDTPGLVQGTCSSSKRAQDCTLSVSCLGVAVLLWLCWRTPQS